MKIGQKALINTGGCTVLEYVGFGENGLVFTDKDKNEWELNRGQFIPVGEFDINWPSLQRQWEELPEGYVDVVSWWKTKIEEQLNPEE